jgi:hypothetical protein
MAGQYCLSGLKTISAYLRETQKLQTRLNRAHESLSRTISIEWMITSSPDGHAPDALQGAQSWRMVCLNDQRVMKAAYYVRQDTIKA